MLIHPLAASSPQTHPTRLSPKHPVPLPAREPSTLRAALGSEWTKLRSVRSTPAVIALTAAVSAALVIGLTIAAPDTVSTISDALAFPIVFSAIFAAVTGVALFTSEVQHRTLEPALIAQPRRRVLVAAKAISAAGLGAAIAVVGQITGLVVGIIAGVELGDGGLIAARTFAAGGFVALTALIGLGVGIIVRYSVAATSGLLVWWLVVENLVVTLAPARIARYLPFVAGNAMVGVDMDSPDAAATALSPWGNTALLATYATAALAIGTVVLHRRDEV